ncbi:MAG: GNAT family N-acetyltransferase [Flavobacteriales bacterium]|nr:GNAT family N-acetyltransferase [Flavobacteriales bacterium]MCB9196884.1 GNAT family N-acetyltransferase [Flavobacteriales bacterium]
MERIIDPIALSLIKSELNEETFIRTTNKGENEIYIFDHRNAPNLMKEVGRLREVTFRAAGGGTGKPLDIDHFDLDEQTPYEQLIVWDPKEEEIVGGYRFIKCHNIRFENGEPYLATSHLFDFSAKFIADYLPYTIELGRSFVQPKYQPSAENRNGLFSLDNLWDGLGAIVVDNPNFKHFFGKVTMYLDFNQEARDCILAFMNTIFPDKEKLVTVKRPLNYHGNIDEFIDSINNLDYKEAHKVLNGKVRSLGENIPPLINAYMNLSSTMKTFGTALNDHFGDVEETGILVTISDIYDSKKERHIDTYHSKK